MENQNDPTRKNQWPAKPVTDEKQKPATSKPAQEQTSQPQKPHQPTLNQSKLSFRSVVRSTKKEKKIHQEPPKTPGNRQNQPHR